MANSAGGGRDDRDRTERSVDERLASLGDRLGAARKKHAPRTGASERGAALGFAVRVAVDMIAGVLVGALIGWWLDTVFGTSPVLLLIFLVLGAAAGIANVMRAARAMQAGSGAGTGRDLPKSDDA